MNGEQSCSSMQREARPNLRERVCAALVRLYLIASAVAVIGTLAYVGFLIYEWS